MLTVCALGGGILLIALFTLAVNLYVQSSGVQQKICQALSEAIQMPVSVFQASYTPWGGFKLSRIEVRDAHPPADNRTPFLIAASLEIRCQTLPLLGGKFVISRISVHQPVLTWQQNQNGDWEWPATRNSQQESRDPAVEARSPANPGPDASLATSSTPTPPPMESDVPPQKQPVTVRKIALNDGRLLFINNDGREIARLEGVRSTIDAGASPGSFTGKLWIKRILLRERYEIADFNSPVSVSNESIDVPRIAGSFAGGKIKGSAKLETGEPGTPFALKLKITKASLATICTTDPEIASHIKGFVQGQMELTGLGSHSGSNQGIGDFEIRDGAFQQYPLLQTVGQILRVDELETLTLNSARLHLDVRDSLIHVQPLEVESQNLRLSVTGTVSPEHTLNLGARLFINEKTWKRLPSEARENFLQTPERKERALDFKVHGNLGQPQTDLLKRLIGDRLQKKMQRFFGSFFDDNRDKGPTDSAEPNSSASPSKSTP
ncbi:MAG TPA: AsmA-like C-terminal region-containing protein [Chthoniobacterales bacterium]